MQNVRSCTKIVRKKMAEKEEIIKREIINDFFIDGRN